MKIVKIILVSVLNLMLISEVYAQSGTVNSLTKGAQMLFKSTESKLNNAERNLIFKRLGFVLTGQLDLPFALDKESLDYAFTAGAFVTDMNLDGKEEIFVLYGNSYTSGMTGMSAVLFIKDGMGNYNANLGFQAMVSILPTTNLGYPDLLIGGPGFEFPVWRWNGKQYDLYKKMKSEVLEKTGTIEVEELSKRYLESLKN